MCDIAFLFPGQGSQFAGMGKSLTEQYPAARRVFEQADETLGFPISTLCFEGPAEELEKTENQQPALLTVSTAAHRVLQELGYQPAFVAGHSLGEYSALVAAGSLALPDALQLVRKRAQFMQEAVPHGIGAMAALLKLPEGTLERILEEAAQGEVLSTANFNSPEQVVVAGHAKAVERAAELAKAVGAKRTILLRVSAPFHSPLMLPAQQKLRPHLDSAAFADLTVPLINNWQAQCVTTAAAARQGLLEQIPNPVRWTESIRELARRGIQRFVEIGPGSVLTGLCRSIDPALRGAKFCAPADLAKLKDLLT